MKKVIILLMLTVFPLFSEGRDNGPLEEAENSVLQIRQKSGTDKLLAEWLASAGVKEDTIYAFIYSPGSCPRCESSLKTYHRALERKGCKFVLITVNDDSKAAALYNRRKGYDADYYIYDTDKKFESIFSFNNVPLDGTDIMKLTRTGRLISGYNGNLYSPKLFAQLVGCVEPMDYKDFGGDDENSPSGWLYPVSSAGAGEMTAFKDYRLDVSPEVPLGKIFRAPYFVDNVFFYPDEIFSSVLFFRQDEPGGDFKFKGELAPTEQEKNRFIQIGRSDFDQMSVDNGVHYIICNAWPLDSTELGMSYSLPNIFYEQPDSDIAYINQACILPRHFSDLSVDTCATALDFDVFHEKFFYRHFQFSSTGSNIILGCQKITWPGDCPASFYKGKVDIDPFMPGFYNTENPFMAEFDRKTGKLVKRFGHLDELARKTSTGYYFVDPISTVSGGELAYTDAYSGKVYVADTADVAHEKCCYEVFKIDEGLLPPVDTAAFYSYDAAKRYRSVFCRRICDMRITPSALYCVVAYGDMSSSTDARTRYTFVTIDRATGRRTERVYPEACDGYVVFTRGLRVLGGKVYPFEVLKGKGKAVLRVYLGQ